MNRRGFLTWVASVATMWRNNVRLSWTKILTWFWSSFKPHMIQEHQVQNLYEFLWKTLPDYYIDLDNIDPIKLRTFQKWLLETLWSSHITGIKNLWTIKCFEDLEYWMIDMYMQDYEKTLSRYHSWFQWLPKNIRGNILSNNNEWLNILFNEDSIIDHAICSIEGFERPSEKSLFSYLKTWWKLAKWDIEIEFSFDSRDYNERWRYRLISNSIQQWTPEISLDNPSELSRILEMPEWWLEEIMNKSEKIELKEIKNSDVNNSQEKNSWKNMNQTSTLFQSFLLNTTSMTDIKNYTWDQVQEVLDYLHKSQEIKTIKI